jgi:hypothetical protein
MEAKAHRDNAMAAILSLIAGYAESLIDALNNQTDATVDGAAITARDYIDKLVSLQEALERVANPHRRPPAGK